MHLLLILLSATSVTLIGWRMSDPVGSYEMLFWTIESTLKLFRFDAVLTRAASIWLLDQFNGMMVGVSMTSLCVLFLKAVRYTAAAGLRWMFR